MPRYATSLPMAWRLNATGHDQLSSMVWRLSHGTRPAFLHGLAIKGVKSHGTRPASRHALAIKGVKCQDTRPAFPMVWNKGVKYHQHDPMSCYHATTSSPWPALAIRLNATIRDQHYGLAIKGVKSHGT
uniref:hypothetical protein n=1 Tax=Escherichia coli TaxID=562 RepID=UPI0021CCB476|nr:hypothetical protein [Escherichia coli]UWM21429.1 hypothetical protein [Escherichia coli]